MNRLSNNDKTWGPFTLGRWSKTFSFNFSTGDEEDEPLRNRLLITAFGWALRIALPNLVPPLRIRHEANWDAATVKRLGRNHYFTTFKREYGFTLSDLDHGYDFLQIHYGPQTHDSLTTKSWCTHLPWKQWDCVRHSYYHPAGNHFFTAPRKARFLDWYEKAQQCPASYFEFQDYDGARIVATCRIEEREWHRGTGWFKWLKWFWPKRIRRSLDIKFSAEVGAEKGSWKGGALGHGIDMLPGETPLEAFKRYCALGHSRKGNTTPLQFIGPCQPTTAVLERTAA